MKNSNIKNNSADRIHNLSKNVVWWKVVGVIIGGFALGIVISNYFFSYTIGVDSIFQGIQLLLIACILALLLDVRRLIINSANRC